MYRLHSWFALVCTPQVRQLAIVTLAARLNLLFSSTLSFENCPNGIPGL